MIKVLIHIYIYIYISLSVIVMYIYISLFVIVIVAVDWAYYVYLLLLLHLCVYTYTFLFVCSESRASALRRCGCRRIGRVIELVNDRADDLTELCFRRVEGLGVGDHLLELALRQDCTDAALRQDCLDCARWRWSLHVVLAQELCEYVALGASVIDVAPESLMDAVVA